MPSVYLETNCVETMDCDYHLVLKRLKEVQILHIHFLSSDLEGHSVDHRPLSKAYLPCIMLYLLVATVLFSCGW